MTPPAGTTTATREDGGPPAPVRAVLAAVRRTGTHGLPPPLLDRLAAVRAGGVHDPRLAAFLDSVLARRDDRFRNRTYLALPLLEHLLADPRHGLGADGMAALLMDDVLRHETAAAGAGDAGAGAPPDERTRSRRLRHARRVRDRCAAPDAPARAGPVLLGWLAASALPVSALHDEHFFLRALQCHEVTFAVAADAVRAATRAVRAGDPAAAVGHLRRADDRLRRGALLFPLVATMRPAAFLEFRVHTDGASAIQSDQYKRFEAACGPPHPRRLRTDAFVQVPEVRAEVLAGGDTLAQALLESRCADPRRPGWDVVLSAVRLLEDDHQRWKTAHHGLAARVLGDAPGSGHTSGVPYLREGLANRLFRHLPAPGRPGPRRHGG